MSGLVIGLITGDRLSFLFTTDENERIWLHFCGEEVLKKLNRADA